MMLQDFRGAMKIKIPLIIQVAQPEASKVWQKKGSASNVGTWAAWPSGARPLKPPETRCFSRVKWFCSERCNSGSAQHMRRPMRKKVNVIAGPRSKSKLSPSFRNWPRNSIFDLNQRSKSQSSQSPKRKKMCWYLDRKKQRQGFHSRFLFFFVVQFSRIIRFFIPGLKPSVTHCPNPIKSVYPSGEGGGAARPPVHSVSMG